MEKKQNSQTQNKAVKKEKFCPFDKDLACKDCRLFIKGRGTDERICAFVQIAGWMPL